MIEAVTLYKCEQSSANTTRLSIKMRMSAVAQTIFPQRTDFPPHLVIPMVGLWSKAVAQAKKTLGKKSTMLPELDIICQTTGCVGVCVCVPLVVTGIGLFFFAGFSFLEQGYCLPHRSDSPTKRLPWRY